MNCSHCAISYPEATWAVGQPTIYFWRFYWVITKDKKEKKKKNLELLVNLDDGWSLKCQASFSYRSIVQRLGAWNIYRHFRKQQSTAENKSPIPRTIIFLKFWRSKYSISVKAIYLGMVYEPFFFFGLLCPFLFQRAVGTIYSQNIRLPKSPNRLHYSMWSMDPSWTVNKKINDIWLDGNNGS